MRQVRLMATFYRSFCLPALLVSASCAYSFYQFRLRSLSGVLWLKIASMALIFWYIQTYKKKEFHYYENLGISRKLILCATFGFDAALYFMVLFLINTWL